MSAAGDARERLELRFLPTLDVGERLPSEAELARELGVSRTTVRQALSLMESDGLVERRWGVGTFVADTQPQVRRTTQLFAVEGGFDRMLTSTGGRPGLASFSFEREGPRPDLFAQTPDVPTYHLHRVFTLDDQPVVVVEDVIPREFNGRSFDPGLLSSLDVTMHRALASIGIAWTGMDLEVWADMPDAETIDILGLDTDEPITRTRATGHTNDGQLLFVATARYRSSLLHLHMAVDSTAPSPPAA